MMNIKRPSILTCCFATSAAFICVALPRQMLLLFPVWAIVVLMTALPQGVIFARSMFGNPNTMTCMTTKEVLLVSAFSSIGNLLIRLVACFACALRWPTFPKRRAFFQSISRCPYAAASAPAEAARLTFGMLKRLITHLAYCGCGGHDSPCMVAGAIAKVWRINAVRWVLQERIPAIVASELNHNKASLTRGADIGGWGKPVSVSSGSKWFMRPLLSLRHYTAYQCGMQIDGRSKRRSHSTAYRADGLEVRTNTNASDCLRSFLILELETA